LKITGITLVVIFLLLLVLPVLFKGKIIEIAKNEINKTMNAKVDFSRLSLSFIKGRLK
jgi:Na+-transporting methylmalonyl-CoA/oxaloacetate decarboxylase gamma subunit